MTKRVILAGTQKACDSLRDKLIQMTPKLSPELLSVSALDAEKLPGHYVLKADESVFLPILHTLTSCWYARACLEGTL